MDTFRTSPLLVLISAPSGRRCRSGGRLACRRAGHLARRKVRRDLVCLDRNSGGRDAPLYGRRDARRYAAHKAIDLASQLVKLGHVVNVVLTADAQRFVTPLPFKTLSRRPVVTDLYDEEEGWKPTHITLADEADLLLVAPATANTLAKMAHGLADDALSCVALALNPLARTVVAPAMNGKMWGHAATQANVEVLKSRGVMILGPAEGLLSCGYEGVGRLLDVEAIVAGVTDLMRARGTGAQG
jgi:phosphopantothenoylcysteine decarboxylase